MRNLTHTFRTNGPRPTFSRLQSSLLAPNNRAPLDDSTATLFRLEAVVGMLSHRLAVANLPRLPLVDHLNGAALPHTNTPRIVIRTETPADEPELPRPTQTQSIS